FLYELDRLQQKRWSSTFNDAIAETCSSFSNRLEPVATLPMGFPDLAVEEVYRVAQLGFQVAEIGTGVQDAELDDASFEPVFAALADTGLMVLLHPHYIDGRYASNRFHAR